MALSAGDLDRRISIRRPTLTRDGQYRPVTSWVPVAVVWSSWRRATANERLASAQVSAQVTDIFEIRWSSRVQGVDPKCEIDFAGRVYDIVDVTEIGRREGLIIRASARADT